MERYAVGGDGTRVAWEAAGSGDPALVLVHGWCGDRSALRPQFDHFSARHTVVSLDLRGHGASDGGAPGRDGYRTELFADDVLAAAGAAGVRRPVVVGHSLGALVALECAARPGAVRAVVLLDPAAVLSRRGREFFTRSVPEVAADTDGSWRRRFAGRLYAPADTVRRAETIEAMAAVEPERAAAGMAAMAHFAGDRVLEAVTAAGVPVLLVTAGEPESGLREHPGFSHGRTVGSGHFLQLEVPDQVNAMIDRFLALRVAD